MLSNQVSHFSAIIVEYIDIVQIILDFSWLKLTLSPSLVSVTSLNGVQRKFLYNYKVPNVI